MNPIDHLLYATPDLEFGIDQIERRLGVRAVPGGRHPAWGTRNALVGLGADCYLEILAPDPDAPPSEEPRPLGLDHLVAPRLATWAARATDLEAIVEAGRSAGVDLGPIRSGSRERPDGGVLSWRATELAAPRLDGVVPFFIDWVASPHPAAGAVAGGPLIGLIARHPDPARVRAVFRALDLDPRVEEAPGPGLIATIRSPLGTVVLD